MFLSWVKTQLTPGIMLCGKRRLVQPLARTWIMNLLLFTYRCVCYISIYLSISISSISIYLISNFNTHRYMHILKSSKEFHWYTSLQANLYQVLFLLLLMSAGINQFLLRLSAVLYTGDSQRELSKKPYGFNLVTAMISWLPSAYSAVHFISV